jgi:hypothetical protein
VEKTTTANHRAVLRMLMREPLIAGRGLTETSIHPCSLNQSPAPPTAPPPPPTPFRPPPKNPHTKPGEGQVHPIARSVGFCGPILNENRLWLNPKILPSTILGIHGLDSPQDLFSAKSRPVWEGSQQFAHTHRSRHTPKNEPGCGRPQANPFVSRSENCPVAGSNTTLQ